MSKSDLTAVGARRGAIAEKLRELETAEAQLHSEIAELDTTARVLERLGAGSVPREHSPPPMHYVEAEPLHKQAIARLRNLLRGDAG